MDKFLAVNKSYFRMGLKSIDILIISQIEEFERNKCKCFITNEQFSEMFGESVSTIKRALDKLDDLKIIKRNNSYVEGNGRANKQRVLSLNNRSKWKVQNEPTIEPIEEMEGSNVDNGRFKNEEWKVHNELIKDNLKENKKENLSKNADAKKETSSKKLRELEDLSIEELQELDKLFKLNDRENYGYLQLKKMFNLKCSLDKNLSKKIETIVAQKQKEAKNEITKAQFSAVSDSDIAKLADFLRCDTDEVLDNLCALGVNANYMLRWIDTHGECTISIADDDEHADYRKSQGYDTYFKVVEMMVRNNQIKDEIDDLVSF